MRVVNRSVVLLLILASASSGEAATEVKQILVVQSLDQATLTFGALADDLKVELSRRLPEPLNFVKFSLEPPGLGEVSDEGLVAYLRSLFPAVRRPDLIVTVGAPAALFVRAHEAQLFPAAPVLMVGVDGRFLNGAPLPANVATVAVTHDVPRMIQTIVQLFPDTAHLFVVNGTSKLEQSWQVAIGREMAQFPRLTLEWANGLSFAEMLTRTATLPAHSVVLFVLFNVDAQGAGYDEERVIRAIHERANAPMFGFQSTALGQGIVGGPLMPIDDVGHHAVDAAVRLLNGESPGHIRTPAQEPGLPVFDWRELRRWHVDESRLPSGSVVQFREPTLWQRRKWQLMTAGLIGIAESLLIIGLVVNLATRKRTERALRESEERFRRLADTAPVMIWMSGLDQRCTDVNRSWLDFTGRSRDEELGIGWASVVHPDDVADMRDVATRAFERREPYRNEYRVRRHDG
jgi:PAS domain-containing protein